MRIAGNYLTLEESQNRKEKCERQAEHIDPVSGRFEIIYSILLIDKLFDLQDFCPHEIEKEKNSGSAPNDIDPGQTCIVFSQLDRTSEEADCTGYEGERRKNLPVNDLLLNFLPVLVEEQVDELC